VNPADPSEAVLEPGFTPLMILVGVLPLVMMFTVGGAFLSKTRHRRAAMSASAGPSWIPRETQPQGVSPYADINSGAVTLKPKHSAAKKLIGAIIITLIWNGIVAVVLYKAFEGIRQGDADWTLVIFMLIFALIGIALVGVVIYLFLDLFNPRPELKISAAQIPLGSDVRLDWRLSGAASRVERFRIYLEGEEETIRNAGGKNSQTYKEVFRTIPIVETTDPHEMRSAVADVSIPVKTMHFFKTLRNKIRWRLHVRGDIARWPDVREVFDLTILFCDYGDGE